MTYHRKGETASKIHSKKLAKLMEPSRELTSKRNSSQCDTCQEDAFTKVKGEL